ncbi:HAD-IA family hydrolase [Apilactobacillus apisilvae]|uniref:HAD-IA family hydrolase n=1 Tax=Apilactobacillus apisilvae TaxID=2923364 RepID=A0ABY4PJ23_9LACO|nr:HAD-IA family hydrolase [Apilactobacillus apisilvae]UQS85456.1 HAD-IA family hydrolase [Apilactobacillus apisilvae]
MQKNVFWDFDGTLFDTYPIMAKSFSLAMQKMNIEELEIDEYDILVTMRQHSLATALQKFSAEFNLDEGLLKSNYKSIEKDKINISKPFLNVDKVLTNIIKNNGKNYLLTHRDNKAIELLKKFNFNNFFDDTVTKSQDFKRKPDPESLNYLISKHNIERNDALMIGDRKIDIDASHNAGIKGCLFDNNNIIKSKGNPEMEINNYYDFLNDQFK